MYIWLTTPYFLPFHSFLHLYHIYHFLNFHPPPLYFLNFIYLYATMCQLSFSSQNDVLPYLFSFLSNAGSLKCLSTYSLSLIVPSILYPYWAIFNFLKLFTTEVCWNKTMKLNKMFFVFLFYFDCIQQSVEMNRKICMKWKKEPAALKIKWL